MDILTLFILWVFTITGYVMGRRVAGSKGNHEEKTKAPTTPITAYKRHKADKKVQKENERMEIILNNIEAYDGSGSNQREIPNL